MGIALASVAGIGVVSAGVAVTTPGRHAAKPSTVTPSSSNPDDGNAQNPSNDQAPQPVNTQPNVNPPAATSGGS